MNLEKPKRRQITTTLDASVQARIKELNEPLSKFLDRAIVNELSRSATATALLAEAFHECIKSAVIDALEEYDTMKKNQENS